MNLEEAKAMISPEAMQKLHDIVDVKPAIDFSKKVNNDLLMAALCKAVDEEVIKPKSMDDRLVKLLNSETNTISQSKLHEILQIIQHGQPNIVCKLSISEFDGLDVFHVYEHEFTPNETVTFNSAFDAVLTAWSITPSDVRRKMTETLKPTIVNNVSQLISKYYKSSQEERDKMVISISTIQRLVNMSGGIITAEFIDNDDK